MNLSLVLAVMLMLVGLIGIAIFTLLSRPQNQRIQRVSDESPELTAADRLLRHRGN